MEITYTGPFDVVDVPFEESGAPRLVTFERGKATECPEHIAERLLEQADNWKRGTASRGKAKDSTTPPTE